MIQSDNLTPASDLSTSADLRSRQAVSWRSLSLIDLLAFLLLALPFATAAGALIHTSVNIPFEDDYQSIANFIHIYADQPGALQKVGWVLTSQHNEYKLVLLHTVVALQYELTGHINYKALQLLGDLAVPAIVGLIWLLLARQRRPFQQSIWLFLLPCYLLLGISYSETMNFAMSEFATLAIIPIAIACILCFTSSAPRMVLWGSLLLALGIATLASGFFVSIALIPILLYQRRYVPVSSVLLVTAAMAIFYSLHYTVDRLPPSNSASHATILIYPVIFLGAIFPSLAACAVTGAVLILVSVVLLAKGWPRRSPDTFTIALFCLVTAAAVAAGRYSLGLQYAMAGRYSVYAVLLICAEYLAILEIFPPRYLRKQSRWVVALGLATIVASIWTFDNQAKAYRNLHARQRLLMTHLILWQRHPDRIVLTPDEPGYLPGASWMPWRVACQQILQREISAGRYIPPVSASDPLPLQPHSASTAPIENEQAPTRESQR